MIGKTLGPYEFIEPLGAGGMGDDVDVAFRGGPRQA